MKRPSKLVEALLLKVISQMAGGKSALKEVMESIAASMDKVEDKEQAYTQWIEDYTDSIDELNAILNHYMGTTLTECAGQTRIAGEIIPKDVLGLVSTEALEAFARAMVEKESVQ
jgi:tetrahydromethanopterin S-methyltransferase subunit B